MQSGPGKIAGAKLTITGVGTVVVATNQAGNANYTAAPTVEQSIVVIQATPAVNLKSSANVVAAGKNVEFTATMLGGCLLYTSRQYLPMASFGSARPASLRTDQLELSDNLDAAL